MYHKTPIQTGTIGMYLSW